MLGRGRALDGRLDRSNRSRPGREPGARAGSVRVGERERGRAHARAKRWERERVRGSRNARKRKATRLPRRAARSSSSYSGTVALTTRIHACAYTPPTIREQRSKSCARQFRPSPSPPYHHRFHYYHHPTTITITIVTAGTTTLACLRVLCSLSFRLFPTLSLSALASSWSFAASTRARVNAR